MKKIFVILLAIIVLLLLVIILSPARIDPAEYNPKKAPALTGVMQENQLLLDSQLLAKGQLNGPEGIAISKKDEICSGTQDGDIKCISLNGEINLLTNTGGRPLGMKFDHNQQLIVCDAYKGLLSVSQNGEITVLATTANGVDFKFTDDLDIANDGMIYFTDASYKYKQSEYLYDLLEARAYGRFMSYNPKTKKVKVLLDDLYFANGVALSQNQDFVLINETYRYRIVKYWLKT